MPLLSIFGAVFVGLVAICWSWAIYNRFVALRHCLREAWSDIDAEMKRRYDLIPNLLLLVQQYAAFEREVFEQVARLRTTAAANSGAPDSQAADEEQLCLGLRRVFAVAEAYPALRAEKQFLGLQRQLADTEDRIAAARRFYNGNVRDLNRLREQFPTNLVAKAMGVGSAEYFQLSAIAERVVPRVGLES